MTELDLKNQSPNDAKPVLYAGHLALEADWDNDSNSNKYVIKKSYNELFTDWYESTYHFLAFKSAAIRDEFLKNFEPLIKEYFEL